MFSLPRSHGKNPRPAELGITSFVLTGLLVALYEIPVSETRDLAWSAHPVMVCACVKLSINAAKTLR